MTTRTKEIVNKLLDDLISNTIVKSYENHVKNMRSYIRNYYNKIDCLEKDIKLYEKKIYQTCNHDWVRDYDDRYSRYKICTKCGLSNIPYTCA